MLILRCCPQGNAWKFWWTVQLWDSSLFQHVAFPNLQHTTTVFAFISYPDNRQWAHQRSQFHTDTFSPNYGKRKGFTNNTYQSSFTLLLQEKSQANALIIIKQAMLCRSSLVPSCLTNVADAVTYYGLYYEIVLGDSFINLFPGPSQQRVANENRCQQAGKCFFVSKPSSGLHCAEKMASIVCFVDRASRSSSCK